jgi:hypothetical protein
MPDFNVRSESIDVEQIMEQIRTRIREKNGVDYTEQQLRDLAAVKLEKFLDPRSIRSDLLQQFKREQPRYEPPVLPNYQFEDATLFESHRGPIRWIRQLLRPILKLFFNPNPLIQALHVQSQLNTLNADREAQREASRHALDHLHYEVIHNLVVELTRLGIENKNLKMRVESLASRLDFNERRARALESVVVYRPSGEEPRIADREASPLKLAASAPAGDPRDLVPSRSPQSAPTGMPGATGEGPGQRSRRRRRRRGRHSGPLGAGIAGSPSQAHAPSPSGSEGPEEEDAHAVAAESIEQALAADSAAAEGSAENASNEPSNERSGPGGPESDQQ